MQNSTISSGETKEKINNKFDVIVVGGGPIGLACGIFLQKYGYTYIIIEKGCLVNSIYNFPSKMTFFTYNYDIAIGDIPFSTDPTRPTRNEALAYYRTVTMSKNLNISLYEEVIEVSGEDGNFVCNTKKTKYPYSSFSYTCKKVFIATGYYDNPNYLNIPGENNPSLCSHYYTDPHPYFGQKVIVVGGGNSAAEAALDLYRHNVNVILIHRGSQLKKAIKYWVMPDIQGRIRDGEIPAYFNTTLKEITNDNKVVTIRDNEHIIFEDISYVFILTGYHPNYDFLRKIGVKVNDRDGTVIFSDRESLESTKKGIHIIGSAAYGINLNKIFIENGRFEAEKAVISLKGKLN
jgi:thioredoxin reductase (NADPH)